MSGLGCQSILMQCLSSGLFSKQSEYELELSDLGFLSNRVQIVLFRHVKDTTVYRAKVSQAVQDEIPNSQRVPHALLVSYAMLYPELDSFVASSVEDALAHVMHTVFREQGLELRRSI